VGRRLWAPGLEEGYIPQGLAAAGAHILVAGYRDAKDGGGCRVFRLDAKTGEPAGSFEIAGCNHAGGLAHVGQGLLVVTDTRRMWRVEMDKAFAAGKIDGAVRGTVALVGELYGSFAAFDGTDLWIGRYTVQREAANAKLHRVPLKVFDDLDGREMDESKVAETLPSPPLGQGMTFQGKDTIWIASSSSQIGWLHRIERATGTVLARHDTVIGIEGIDFADGRLWAVSEAGAKKYLHWKAHFPIVFTIDPGKLR
jgi:hypothetical protein